VPFVFDSFPVFSRKNLVISKKNFVEKKKKKSHHRRCSKTQRPPPASTTNSKAPRGKSVVSVPTRTRP
jgi:hypothetical protein